MANNATISWQDFSALASAVASNADSFSKSQWFYSHVVNNGKTTATKKSIVKNFKDIGIVCLKYDLSFPKGSTSVNIPFPKDSTKNVSIGNILSDSNCIFLAFTQHDQDDSQYTVHFSKKVVTVADLFNQQIPMGKVMRNKKSNNIEVCTVHILAVCFPN